jgi:cobalt/nickel transport system permease protein
VSARLALAVYAAALFTLSVVHDVRVLAGALVVVALLAGRRAPRLLRRSLLAAGLFALTVSAGVVVMGLWRGDLDTQWLVRTNLRVWALTSLTLLAVERIDLARALAPWPGVLVVLTLAGAQIRLLQRQLDDLKLGLRSRSLCRPTARTVAQHAASSGAQFLGRALHDAEEISLAMRSRGVWHVRRE